ncbi:MAG: chemotaxis protein CheZ [Motiliproteus sp.]|jgi:chemotaxis protein CheZ
MSGKVEVTDLKSFEETLHNKAQDLLRLSDEGDLAGAMTVLAELSDARNSMLYTEVGRLTRGLHEAIKEFNLDVEKTAESATPTEEGSTQNKVSSAQGRLDYVLELTESAANKTMDMIEASMPVAAEMGEQAGLLRQDWKAMADQPSTMPQLKDLGRTTEAFLQEIERGSASLQSNFSEIFLAQGFQDITGQLIKRVNGLVQDVEKSLITLVAVAGKVDRIAGTTQEEHAQSAQDAAYKKEQQNVKGHGPLVLKEESAGVVTGQDDVDDLLSSLGF